MAKCPDLRIGQIIDNAHYRSQVYRTTPLFYLGDEPLNRILEEYLDDICKDVK